MRTIKEEETTRALEVGDCALAGLSQTTMLEIINAQTYATKRAMDILGHQATETEARLASENLTPEQFDVLIEERKAIRKAACEQACQCMFKSFQFGLYALALLLAGTALEKRS